MRARIACMIVALSLLVLALTGCSTQEPVGSPDIRGIISAITMAETGDGGTLLVMGEIEDNTTYDRAYISVDADVEITDMDGKRVAFRELSPRIEVEVWFTGPVAESYPVQATAMRIVVLGYDTP